MALKATIYKADLQVADLDRAHFGDYSLTIARHPSETDERMMVRLLALPSMPRRRWRSGAACRPKTSPTCGISTPLAASNAGSMSACQTKKPFAAPAPVHAMSLSSVTVGGAPTTGGNRPQARSLAGRICVSWRSARRVPGAGQPGATQHASAMHGSGRYCLVGLRRSARRNDAEGSVSGRGIVK